MQIIAVNVQVKPECVEAFKAATQANVEGSLREPGIAQFDLCQLNDDGTRFLLIEAYRTPEAVLAHKETAHYKTWRDAVNSMMAVPRSGFRYTRLFPTD